MSNDFLICILSWQVAMYHPLRPFRWLSAAFAVVWGLAAFEDVLIALPHFLTRFA